MTGPLTTEELLAQHASVNLIHVLTRLARGKRRIAVTALVCCLCGLAGSLALRPTYTASTRILAPQPQRTTGAAAMMSQLGGGDGASLAGLGSAIQAKSAADLYAGIIGARPVADALIERFHLEQVYRVHTLIDARKALAAHTAIEPAKEGFISVTVSDHDAERSAAMANAYIEELRVLMHGLALTEAAQRRLFYEGQLVRSRDALAAAEIGFKQMQQGNHIVAADAQARAALTGAAELRAQLAVKQVALERLRASSTEANPQVQIAVHELAALRAQLAQAETRNDGGYSGTGLNRFPEAQLKLVRAERELKYQESLYEMLLRQYEGSRIDEARDAPIVQVVEQAVVPELASSPKRGLIALGSLLFGVLLGFAWVLLQEWRKSLPAAEADRWSSLRRALLQW